VANRLRQTLTEYLGDSVWVRIFDLNAGALVLDSIEVQLAQARWLIVLYTAAAAASSWVQVEARTGTIRAIEDEDFRLVVLRMDATPVSPRFQTAFHTAEVVDLSQVQDYDTEFMRLADVIERTDSTKSQHLVYVDRGADSDRVSLLLRRNRVLFVLGFAGIGKSTFVDRSVSRILGKRPLAISLSRGHSFDLLCRQILQAAHVSQLIAEPGGQISDAALQAAALDALRLRAPQFFVFLDDAESGLDPSNRPFPYLERLLDSFLKADIRTHILLATTRNPDMPAFLSTDSAVDQLSGLETVYVKECLDLWLQETPQRAAIVNDPGLVDVITLIDGHPLAAKMVASYLKVRPISQFLLPDESRRFQLKLADYVLRANDLQALNDLHHLILLVLAAIRQPVSLTDLLAVRLIRAHPLDDVQNALGDLTNLFLVEHDGELLYLHRFLETYYADRASADPARLREIARDFGNYAYARAIDCNEQLKSWYPEDTKNTPKAISLSNTVFRYAISADRLLRSVGEKARAEDLPIQVRGTLREMVFYFYQEAHDYKTALAYAEQWLAFNATDLEVMLYRVRCYRNLGDAESLSFADAALSRLEQNDHNRRFHERILREKALVAQTRGDYDKAKAYFLEGAQAHRAYAYPDNHVGLAQLLLREIDHLPPGDPARLLGAQEALKYLEEARQESSIFDRFHLSIYIEALVQAAREDKAMPLIQAALLDKPEDARLNYRMAEILRDRDRFEDAEEYARSALASGAEKARLSLANIRYGQALKALAGGQQRRGEQLLRDGVELLAGFRPEFGTDQEVADSIAAKLHRALGEWERCRLILSKYTSSKNPYTVYELTKIDEHYADAAELSGSLINTLTSLDSGIARVRELASTRELPQQLAELLEALELRRRRAIG